MKVNCVAAEFRKVSDIQMAETTKRAIRENVSVNQHLTKMSGKCVELIRENEKLRRSERELVMNLEVLQDTNKFVTQKNLSRETILMMLKTKALEQEAWSKQLEDRIEHCTDLEEEADQAIAEAEKKNRDAEVSPPCHGTLRLFHTLCRAAHTLHRNTGIFLFERQ